MYMDEAYKRRIRIQCSPEQPVGRGVHITDLETGEEITNIVSVTIYLDAREINMARCTYYATNEQGNVLTVEGEPVSKVKNSYNPEIDVTAYEVNEV